MSASIIRNITFLSEGIRCAGKIYIPSPQDNRVPCIVMANGFSGTMDWILPDFAERFSAFGFAALTFDYRYLGESDGEPRQLIYASRQETDLRNAIEYARSYNGIDGDKIVLWGTSLGGSHVIKTAVKDHKIAALILNMPAVDAIKGSNSQGKIRSSNISYLQAIRFTSTLLLAALTDIVKRALHLPPHYINVFGAPGHAVFADQKLATRFKTVEEGSRSWRNRVAAGSLLHLPKYEEGTFEGIDAPILLALARHDTEVSNEFLLSKVSSAKRLDLKMYECEHFDFYHPPMFNQVVNDQIKFLKSVL